MSSVPHESNRIRICVWAPLLLTILTVAVGCQDTATNDAGAVVQPAAATETAAAEPASLPPDVDTATLEVLRDLRDTWTKSKQK